MRSKDDEVRRLITDLNTQFAKVQEHLEFLSIKQSELRPDDEISFFGLLQARKQFACEVTLLAGHAQMVQEKIATEKVSLGPATKALLKDITTFSRQYLLG